MGLIDQNALKMLSATVEQAKISSQENTDEQALKVSNLYDDWEKYSEGDTLTAGTRINYSGVLYKVLQTHQKKKDWTPRIETALFAKVLIPNSDDIPEWEEPDSTNAYMKGDRVTHNGSTWESLVDWNTWEPGAEDTDSVWREV